MDKLVCLCDEEILVVPDLSAVDEAIEHHLRLHLQDKEKAREHLHTQLFNITGNSKPFKINR